MNIRDIELPRGAILAPMAGVTDLCSRLLAHEMGAAASVSEMMSAKGFLYAGRDNRAVCQLLEHLPHSGITGLQLFGSDPSIMAEAAARLAGEGFHFIDINMGCPAPKIVGNGDGSALMKSPDLAARIVAAVKQAVPVPVTVKFRMGWDAQSVNCVEFARLCEQAGADMVAVHGRTRSQQYSGTANWDIIRAVKEAVSIPVAANGDVFAPQDVPRILAHTGADFVMIGRGSLGDPWIFERAHALMQTGVLPPLPPFAERIDTAVRQIELAVADKGERVALLEARKHVNWYLKGVSHVRDFKKRISALTRLDELYALADEMKTQIPD